MNFSEECNAALKVQVRWLQNELRQKSDKLNNLAAWLQRCDFKYSPPLRDFDPRKVSGTVCRLINICDPMYCSALETAAGGRLYNVVVNMEVTSKLLLQCGNLQNHTTIIPLNKISGYNVQLALDLVSY